MEAHKPNNEWWQVLESVIDSEIEQIILKKEVKSILDVGCGDGTNIARLQKRFPHITFTGVDISDKAISAAKSKGIKATFLKKDIVNDELPKGKFDLILCAEVFEHLYDNQKSIATNKINKALERGGYFIMTTPSSDAVLRRVYESDNWLIKPLISAIFKNTYKQRILADFSHGKHHHIGVCSRYYYKKLFARKGFKITKISPTRAFQYEMPKALRALVDFFCITINPWANAFSASLVYTTKKVSDDIIEY